MYALENNDNDRSIPNDRLNYDDGLLTSLDYTPNVYYIILDEYASSKVLKDIFDFDNQNFISQLSARGFHVTENSHSNYANTFLSLTSSLNMEYVNYLTDAAGADSANRKIPYQLISDNNIMNIFKSLNLYACKLTSILLYYNTFQVMRYVSILHLLVNSKSFYGNRRYCPP